MVKIKSMHVTLPARDVKRAATFYTEILGFRIVGESGSRITLAQGDLRLSLMKAPPGFDPSVQPLHLRFTVDAVERVDEIAERTKRLDIPLLEDVRDPSDGSRTVTCLGPDETMIEIDVEPPPSEPATEERPSGSTAEASRPEPRIPVEPSTASAAGQPTRADRYLLEAQKQLARIKEELASLSTSYSPSDIAAAIEEMKQKVAQRISEITATIAERIDAPAQETWMAREADRDRKRRKIEEALARYKQKINQQYEEAIEQEQTEQAGRAAEFDEEADRDRKRRVEEALTRAKQKINQRDEETAQREEKDPKPVRKKPG